MVNDELRELTWPLTEDARIRFLDLSSDDGQRIYIRSLSFLLVRAAKDIIPENHISIEHSLGNGLYVETRGSQPLTEEKVEAIQERMWAIGQG